VKQITDIESKARYRSHYATLVIDEGAGHVTIILSRRKAIAVVGAAASTWPIVGRAQRPVLVAILLPGTPAGYDSYLRAFSDGLRELGYVEGGNIRFEIRFADGHLERLPQLADDLVRLNPSVIVSAPLPASLAARQATKTIPIVMATGADPVRFGLVASLARPGGNVTGLTNFSEVLPAKQIDLLRELVPNLARVGVLVNISNPLHFPQWSEMEKAAKVRGLTLVREDTQDVDGLDAAFAAFAQARVQAVLVSPDTIFFMLRKHIAELATSTGLPAIYGYRDHVEAGGLVSYGPDPREQYRRAATYVDRILKGAKPADLPVEQATKIELVLNLRTARALGISVPPFLLALADEVIE
jgi:putative tryptophan/tyrosine transport system substrate-binding protein